MPELVTLVRGTVVAIRSVVSTLILLFLQSYVMCIVFRSQLGGEPLGRVSETEEEFAERNADDPLALFRFHNITAVVLEIEKRSWALTTLFFAHTFLSNFTLLN